MYFRISDFFLGMAGYILGTKRATRDLLVSKQLDFVWIFVSGLLDFCFLGAFCLYLVNQKSYRRLAGVKMTKVSMAFQIFQKIWIFEYLYFWIASKLLTVFLTTWIRYFPKTFWFLETNIFMRVSHRATHTAWAAEGRAGCFFLIRLILARKW